MARLLLVRRWIGEALPQRDRRLLLAVWRSRRYGWYWTARQVGMGVDDCLSRWDKLVAKLARWMER
ncbi:hypothetical protein [Desulfotomaculum copahuensis]|uniref:hypothetical protein n=1 Tax=Desulfotomaculum copahuensis TaxID=1838280 RepID=UPI0012465CFE|nr:hypothetical protein [Desulfotomaculum copahuensis]